MHSKYRLSRYDHRPVLGDRLNGLQRDSLIEQLETKLHAAVNDKARQVSDLNLIIFRYAIPFFDLCRGLTESSLTKELEEVRFESQKQADERNVSHSHFSKCVIHYVG